MPFNHPRRTTKTPSTLTPTSSNASGRPVVNTNMSLRKGATFHSSTTSPLEFPYHFEVPSLPRRSQTTLEDVVDAHKRRVALTLGDIDRGLSAVEDSSPTRGQSFPDKGVPVPQGFLNHTVGASAAEPYSSIMDDVITQEPADIGIGRHSLRPRHNRRLFRYHASDSGLGSSIVSGSEKRRDAVDAEPTSLTDDHCAKSIVAASAITRSAAAHTSTIESLPRLGARASNRIHEHILKPILAKSSLKDFHPIVKDCPRRIHGKEIVCLRDLEKTLIFMAPERTKTAALYLDFCLTSIRCIQATVEFLNDREQTRPHDRPYTNGYFVDLVDQIKQYALQVAAAKEKEAKGEKLGEMDPESSDEVKLHGGLTENGRPAELVRVKKNGKAISIATGKPIASLEEDSKEAMQMKRSLSEEAEDDESIMRSMARRKRSASAAELAPKRCREPGCEKEFKRPCDLTKHEKTHSRPWKCSVENCKYHEYGWPTEKEMDRHHNDKHSSAPPLYECHYKPCPYRSKRESNCKQHMEKAHGWEYVRSKNNGKNREKALTSALPTPQTTNIRTPSSDSNSVATPDDDDSDMQTRYDGSVMYDQSHMNQELNFPDYSNTEVDMFGTTTHQVPFHLDFSPISNLNQQSTDSSGHPSPYPINGMAITDNFTGFPTNNTDFNLFEGEDLYSANVQLPTPSHSVYQRALDSFDTSNVIPLGPDPMPHISPVGHGNAMLYTPTSLREVDEGFEDFSPSHNNQLGNDFQLFPSSTSGTVTSSAPSALFGEIPSAVGGFPASSTQGFMTFFNPAPSSSMDWSSDDQFSGYGDR